MTSYERHLVQCRCILPQFRGKQNVVFHKFEVFSILNEENDDVVPKIVQCPNCGILHKIIEIGKSQILNGKEESLTLLTIDDIRSSLPEHIVNVLELYNLSLPAWEEVQFIFENKLWNKTVVLASEEIDGIKQGKRVRIQLNGLKIETFINNINI